VTGVQTCALPIFEPTGASPLVLKASLHTDDDANFNRVWPYDE